MSTINRIAEYVGVEYKYGGDIRSTLENEVRITIPHPVTYRIVFCHFDIRMHMQGTYLLRSLALWPAVQQSLYHSPLLCVQSLLQCL